MKKVLAAVLAVFSMAIVAGASDLKGFYIGGSLGMAGGNNFEKLQDRLTDAGVSSKFNDSTFAYGLELGYEAPVISDNQLLGARLGVTWHDEIKLELKNTDPSASVANRAYTIPVSVYYKHLFADSKFALMGGLGVTFVNMTWESKLNSSSDNYNDSKASPHIIAGAEYKFTEVFALGIDLKYAFDTEIKRQVFKRDFNFQGALAARFYLQ
jgi:opacity protein-like surface antigen